VSKLEFISPSASIPLSGAVKCGDLVFASGQVGFKPGTQEVVDGGVAAQTRAALENMKAVLEQSGASVDKVIKTTVFLTNVVEDFPVMNEVYAEFFGNHRPARSTVGVASLARADLVVEIECIAQV